LPQRPAAIVAGDRADAPPRVLFWNAKKLAKPVLGETRLRARVALLERRGRNTADTRPDL